MQIGRIMDETQHNRLKKLKMRSWHRGTKEMDMILGSFADARLAGLDAASLDEFEALLSENDHDLYQWVAGQCKPPEKHGKTISTVVEFLQIA
jgi:antitoxin CptB